MPRQPSNRPTAVRKRLNKAKNEIDYQVEQVKKDLDLLYEKPIDEWDFEELQFGAPRLPSGKFPKNKPKWLTPVMMVEAQRRLEQCTAEELSAYAGRAIDVMVDLMEHSRVDIVRYNASKYVLDQVMGVPTQRVKIEANVEFHAMLADVVQNHDGSTSADVIDLDESEWTEGELGE